MEELVVALSTSVVNRLSCLKSSVLPAHDGRWKSRRRANSLRIHHTRRIGSKDWESRVDGWRLLYSWRTQHWREDGRVKLRGGNVRDPITWRVLKLMGRQWSH